MSRRAKLEQMLLEDPNDPFLKYALAKEFVGEGDTEAALKAFNELLTAHPDYVAGYFHKGMCLADEGETEAAREVLLQGIEVAQRVGDSHAHSEMTGYLEML
ncbi:tetratricopeptide repeat protein [Calycomorphotria hydatis]|uniref:Uncharacterized protein n=1 Tax=Calycomorphotria hydatis TaxID=2528027 RepID=A0A517T720_9PLAN|nr:tetratricopeptide repeat protein [Calycomorphotria hydatis]QDT64174.1 hypothetical protein V22_14050 [Calycomorphotria hydatis]